MFKRIVIVLLFSHSAILSCKGQNQQSEVIATVNDEKEITFNELKVYHSSHFFERRFPDADLKAYPIALEELAVREMKLIDFFEQGFHRDSLLMLDIQRTINEELLDIYFNEVFFEEYLEKVRADGSPEALRNRFLDRGLQAFDKRKAELIPEEVIEWNEEALVQVEEWANRSNFFDNNSPAYRTILSEAIESGYNPVLLRYHDTSIDVSSFHRLLNEVLIPGSSSTLTTQDIKAFLLEAVRTNEMIQLAREQNLHEKLVTKNTPSSFLRARFITLYNRKKILDPIPEPTYENLIAFYEAEKEGELYQLAKRTLHVSLYEEYETALQKWNEFEEGSTFEKISNKRWQVKTFIKDRNQTIHSYLSNEEPYLGEQAFNMQQGEVSGPILINVPNHGEMYAIVRCNAANESGVLEYSEIENIESIFTKYHREKNTRIVEEYLKDKYPLIVNEESLENKVL